MFIKWFPWQFFLRRAARRHGFLDPLDLVARLQKFAQPAEVAAPLELIRAGVVFHARGLVNSQAIQHNLDWIWPFWVERQFDPKDDAFVPRAFSITHVNLTHRNWTALGIPGSKDYALADPRGLLTPYFDGWSIDAWVIGTDGSCLIPSRSHETVQTYAVQPAPYITTTTALPHAMLSTHISIQGTENDPLIQLAAHARAAAPAYLVISFRPYNPEGISFIDHIVFDPHTRHWHIDASGPVASSDAPDMHLLSTYEKGDVSARLCDLIKTTTRELPIEEKVSCHAGMATAAAAFTLTPHQDRTVTLTLPLHEKNVRKKKTGTPARSVEACWHDHTAGCAVLAVPDKRYQFLYDRAVTTLILHSPHEVYPGPYTYRRFWFRDAAFILDALLSLNAAGRVTQCLAVFPKRQTPTGYFLSQEGEWDSNGEALWIWGKYAAATKEPLPAEWLQSIRHGAEWIIRKRVREKGAAHDGLFPAGFSAEHLGPNDFYYWDNFWGIAGLRAAAAVMRRHGDEKRAVRYQAAADEFMAAVTASLAAVRTRLHSPAIPASPYRRLDAGAIGSLMAGYPLNLSPEYHENLAATADYLYTHCLIDGGFFQDMTHSGINPYLTLHLAQVLLQLDDPRFGSLVDAIARYASPTGQWPEAVHPRTKGGCMGDGQHVWAAAEWILMMRSLFLREDNETLVLCSGIPPAWYAMRRDMRFGPTITQYGSITIKIKWHGTQATIRWEASFDTQEIPVIIHLPSGEKRHVRGKVNEVTIEERKN